MAWEGGCTPLISNLPAPRKECSTDTVTLYQELREPNIELAAAAAAWILLQGGKQREGEAGFATSVIWQEVTAKGKSEVILFDPG